MYARNAGRCSTMETVRSMKKEQTQRRKKDGWRFSHSKIAGLNKHCGGKEKKEPLVISGGVLDTEGLEEELFRHKDGGTVVVHKWITDVRYNAFQGMTKVCRACGLEDEDVPQWRSQVTGNISDQLLEDVEARNAFTKNIMWKSTTSSEVPRMRL